MKKYLLVLLASLALVVSSVRCTSGDSSGETGEEIASEGGENPEALSEDGEALVGDATGEGEVTSPETLAEGNLGDPAADPSLDPNTSSETAMVDPGQQALDANGNPIDSSLQTQSTPQEETPLAPTETASTPPPIETVPPPSITETAAVPVPEVKPAIPAYQKMKDSTWVVNKKVVNTVYFARPDDTWNSISQKIYGNEDRVKELKKINSGFRSRQIRVGDKVYYNSPNRPEDNTKVITYYEDKGLTPQVYTAKEGDKVKTISKDLLGFDNAWKEVWGSNAFDSKKTLEPGTEIKYWKEDAPSTTIASTELPPPPPMETAPPPDMGSVPPPPPDMAFNPPPPPDMGQPPPDMGSVPPPPDMGSVPPPPPDMALNPPPPPDMGQPPPPPDMGQPPPPPDMGVQASTAPPSDDSTIAGMDQDTIMIVGIGAAALLLAVIFIVKRKNKQRQEFEQAMNETQVG